MAKTKWKDCVVLVGTTDVVGDAEPLLLKKDVKPDGPKQIRDDTTTDDSDGPEHEVIYAGQFSQCTFQLVKDVADASFVILDDAAKAGTKIFAWLRPQGSGVGLEQAAFACTVDMVPVGSSSGMSKLDVTLMVSGGVDWTDQAGP